VKVLNHPANLSCQHLKRRAINPIDDDSEDNVTPPQETLEPEALILRVVQNDLKAPAMSRTPSKRSTVSTAMMIDSGPMNFRAAMNTDHADQWKETINTDVASMESHEEFTFVKTVLEGASIIQS
jgi:hypothetical protein